MEQKDIVFDKGIHREPSVSLSDAELSECVNLMPRHGELVNMKPANSLGISIPSGSTMLAIHKVDEDEIHYIFKTRYMNVTTPDVTEQDPELNENHVYAIGYDAKLEDGKWSLYAKCDNSIPCAITLVYTFSSSSASYTNGVTLEAGWKAGKIGGCSDTAATIDWVKCTASNCQVLLIHMTGADFNSQTSPVKNKKKNPSSSSSCLAYISNSDVDNIVSLGVDASVKVSNITIVGNVLCLVTDSGLRYVLWREKANKYIYLGETPDIRLDFKLSGSKKDMLFTDSITLSKGAPTSKGYDNEWLSRSTAGMSQLTITASEIASKFPYGSRVCACVKWTSAAIQISCYDGKNQTVAKKYESSIWFTFTENVKSIWVYEINNGSSQMGTFYLRSDTSNTMGVDNNRSIYLSNSEDTSEEKNFKALSGDVKRFIDHYCYGKFSYFIFPFFIRYGIRLVDGSVIHQSEPVLMMPNSGFTPSIMVGSKCDSDQYSDEYANVRVVANCCNIMFKVKILDDFTPWEDIISEIDIAISAPIYNYNEGEEYNKDLLQVPFFSTNDSYGIINERKEFVTGSIADLQGANPDVKELYWAKLPFFSGDKMKENYLNSSVFYRIASYKFSELVKYSSWTLMSTKNMSLKNLQTLPTMSDDYNSRNTIIAKGSFGYNNRLNIYNIEEKIAAPKHIVSPLANYDAYSQYRCIVYYKNKNGQHATSTDWMLEDPYMNWIYIGSTSAYKCVIIRKYGAEWSANYSYKKAEFDLTIHPWLNGAYYLDINDSFNWDYADTITEEEAEEDYNDFDMYELKSNAIYASAASNPFYFPVDLQNEIGTGQVRAVSTAAKALSEGQFGQFPLYAFTDDGIWSLSVDSNGKYSTSNPVNRDVVQNKDSICQIDDAVVYACSQGLKMLSGSETKLLTDAINGRNVDESLFFTNPNNLDSNHSDLVVTDTNSIINMIENCMVMYDPSGKRLLHVYPTPSTGKHYVYDIDNGEWSTEVSIDSHVLSIVPGYPYSTFMTINGTLKQYDNTEDNDTIRYGLLLTREYAMGDPFAMKMLRDLRLVYSNNNDNANVKCKVGVFVSNDRKNWKKLTSLRKHSYKWYRFRIQTALTDIDALTSLSMQIESRRTNKMR